MLIRYVYRAYKARYRDQTGEIRAALQSLKAGDTAVDVGAHKGAYVYWLRKKVGAAGRVIAFEPQPGLATYLREICRRLKWGNVMVRQCALSDTTGYGVLHIPGAEGAPGASLTVGERGEQKVITCACQLETLDRELKANVPLAFLKVDVEGHELQVFRGAQRVLTRHKPRILFECEGRHLRGHSMDDVFAYLVRLGYAGAFFSPRGRQPLARFNPAVHQKRAGDRFWDRPDYCNNFFFEPL